MGSEAQTSYRLSSPLAGLQQHRIRLWEDVSFKLPGQDGGEPLDGGVGVVHDGRCMEYKMKSIYKTFYMDGL